VASVTLATHTYDGLQNPDRKGENERETGPSRGSRGVDRGVAPGHSSQEERRWSAKPGPRVRVPPVPPSPARSRRPALLGRWRAGSHQALHDPTVDAVVRTKVHLAPADPTRDLSAALMPPIKLRDRHPLAALLLAHHASRCPPRTDRHPHARLTTVEGRLYAHRAAASASTDDEWSAIALTAPASGSFTGAGASTWRPDF
jgi:hypothetical protein